jgi:hypothetical protein
MGIANVRVYDDIEELYVDLVYKFGGIWQNKNTSVKWKKKGKTVRPNQSSESHPDGPINCWKEEQEAEICL